MLQRYKSSYQIQSGTELYGKTIFPCYAVSGKIPSSIQWLKIQELLSPFVSGNPMQKQCDLSLKDLGSKVIVGVYKQRHDSAIHVQTYAPVSRRIRNM